jgi:hypothetical protein
MAMHEFHDEDMILDLLDEPAASAADVSARLDGCAQCLSDYAEQRAIVDQLAHLESPALTAGERSDLHSAVFTELESDVVVPIRARRAWDWTRLGTVAAALVGVVAVAGLFSSLGGTDEDIAGDLDTAAVALNADDSAGGLSAEAPLAEADVAGDDAMEESAADSAAIAAPSDLVIDIGPVDRPGFASELERVRNEVTRMTDSSGVLQRYADEVTLACPTEVPDLGAVRAIVTALVDGFEVEVYFDNSGGEFGYASIDCTTYELP